MSLPVTISPVEDFTLGRVKYAGKETVPNIVLLGSNENFLGNFGYELDLGRALNDMVTKDTMTRLGHSSGGGRLQDARCEYSGCPRESSLESDPATRSPELHLAH